MEALQCYAYLHPTRVRVFFLICVSLKNGIFCVNKNSNGISDNVCCWHSPRCFSRLVACLLERFFLRGFIDDTTYISCVSFTAGCNMLHCMSIFHVFFHLNLFCGAKSGRKKGKIEVQLNGERKRLLPMSQLWIFIYIFLMACLLSALNCLPQHCMHDISCQKAVADKARDECANSTNSLVPLAFETSDKKRAWKRLEKSHHDH